MMILYQLVKWMEERANIGRSLKDAKGKGDEKQLLHKKRLVEAKMIETSRWLEPREVHREIENLLPLEALPLEHDIHQDVMNP